MLKKTITYEDFNGTKRTEDFYFHLSEAELTEMELSYTGGLSEYMKAIVAAQDVASVIKLMKELVLKAYGEKSLDGKYFAKVDDNGRPLNVKFQQTEAYTKLFMELATDDKAGAEFIKGLMPAALIAEAEKQNPELFKNVNK